MPVGVLYHLAGGRCCRILELKACLSSQTYRWLSPFGVAYLTKPLRVSPLTTCAQVNKSERKLSFFAQVCVILVGAPY